MRKPFQAGVPSAPMHAPSHRRTITPMALMALAVAALLLVPGAGAHGPPTVRDQDVRLLADHNDDCGGHGPGGGNNCGGSHDLVALDLREAHDATLGDLVYLRLMLSGGSGAVRDVITLKAAGSTKTFELRTSDNKAFTATGFDTPVTVSPARNPDGSQDGARIVVEAGVKAHALGGVGAKIDADYKVDAYNAAGDRRDYMPGGYVDGLGFDQADPNQGDANTKFVRTTGYTLRGPTYYLGVGPFSTARVPADAETTLAVKVTNQLPKTSQVATLHVTGADGFTADWGSGNDRTTLELSRGGSGTATLRLAGDGQAPMTGTLTLTVTSDLGGRSVHQVPYEILPAGAPAPTSQEPDGDDDGSEGAPAPAALLAAVLLLALAAWRRR